jgi:PAS domain S-box-containing protein
MAENSNPDIELLRQIKELRKENNRLARMLKIKSDTIIKTDDLLEFNSDVYRSMFDANPFPMWVFDINSLRFLMVNDAAVKYYGYSREEFLSMTIKEIRPEEDLPHLFKSLEKVATKTGIDETFARHIKKDGTIIDVEITSHEIEVNGVKSRIIRSKDITENKKREAELIKKDIFLDLIGKTAKVGAWEFDAETLQQLWTEEVYRIHEVDFTYNPNVKGGIKFYSLRSRPIIGRAVQRAIEDGKPFDLELELITRKGKRIWVHSIGMAYQENGKTKKVYGSIQDITKQKLTEKVIIEKEQLFEAFFHQAPMGYQSLDGEGYFIEVNQAWLDTLGYSRNEVIGKWFGDFLHPDYTEAFRKRFPQFKEAGKIHSEFKMIHKSGDIRYIAFEGRIAYKNDGSFRQTHCILADITEGKIAHEKLIASQQLIEGIINAIPVRVFWKDRNLIFLGCNQIFARDAGFSDPMEIIGKDDYQMVWHDQAELYRADDKQVMETGKGKFNIEEPQTTPDGKTITLLTSKVPLLNSEGNVIGILGTYIDISDRKHAERVFQEIVEHNPMSIQIVDTNGFTLTSNPAFLSLFGAIPPSDFSIFTDLIKNGFGEFVSRAKNGEVVNFPDINYNVNNIYTELSDKPVWIRAVLFPLIDGSSKPERYVFMHENITERKINEIALEEKIQELQRFQKVIVGRELTMIDLKKEVNELLKKTGCEEKYKIIE